MEIEPALRDHVEVMVAVARGHGAPVGAARAGERLAGDAIRAERLLANLAAAGLLCRADSHGLPGAAYRLARRPAAIGLDEVAEAVEAEPRNHTPAQTAAADVTQYLSRALRQTTRSVLARYSLADFLDGPPVEHTPLPEGGRARPTDSATDRTLAAAPGSLVIGIDTLWARVEAGAVPAVIDVRAAGRGRYAAPPWARWIPLERLARHVDRSLPPEPIVAVCDDGVRSLVAAAFLQAHGRIQASALSGGLVVWQGN